MMETELSGLFHLHICRVVQPVTKDKNCGDDTKLGWTRFILTATFMSCLLFYNNKYLPVTKRTMLDQKAMAIPKKRNKADPPVQGDSQLASL